MIFLKQKSAKLWEVHHDNMFVEQLELSSSSVTNKFSIIATFLENLSRSAGEDFDNWFVSLLQEYKMANERRFVILQQNIPLIKKFVDMYIDSRNIDFSKFVDASKSKKSILFNASEIEQIIRSSSYLKVYSVFSNSENLKLDQKLHKQMYNSLVTLDKDTVLKVFNVVKTKTFKYNITDKYMWEYVKMLQGKTIDVYAVEIFNFIMNSIFVLCDETKNPISYFGSVVDESVKWFLRSVYKGSVVYEDSMASEDIQSVHNDNIRVYACNDTLGRLEKIAHEKIYAEIERCHFSVFGDDKVDKEIREFDERIKSAKFFSPLWECLTFPLLSKISGIPYEHLRTLTPKRCIVISIYLQGLLREVFKGEYDSLFSMMSYYPEQPCAIHTTYKLKHLTDIFIPLMNTCTFLNFRDKVYLYKVLSYFAGRLARTDFINPLTGEKLVGIPLSKIEADMIKFYSYMFADKLDRELEELSHLLNCDL